MNRLTFLCALCARLIGVAAVVSVLLLSCADREDESFEGAESRSLHEWIRINRPDLVENYQTDGGYYVDVLSLGDAQGASVADTVCWVWFDFTGRSLAGDVCLTRNELTARQLGTFTRYTHYVPFFKYCGLTSGALLDGVHLALRNELTLGDEYAKEHDLPQTVRVYDGTQLTIYMPSSVIGVGGVSGSGGYEGQEFGGTAYTLSDNRPMIVRLKVDGIVKNPIDNESGEVDKFAEENGGVKPFRTKPDKTTSSLTRGREEPPFNDGYAWRAVTAEDPMVDYDTLPQLYLSHTFAPSLRADSLLKYRNTYVSSVAPYDNMKALDEKINQALIDRFGYGTLDGDSVKLTGTAKIWYIGRFLDGFIFDTNIDEVKKLIYDKVDKEGSALAYTPESSKESYVTAWYYAVSHFRFGQWGAVVGTSSYFYGATGKEGATSTTSTGSTSPSYDDMYNYYNYMNSYYGNYNYLGYYDNYYGGDYSGYASTVNTSGTTTTTTVSTEIQAYTPLLFEIYIEPEE